MVKICHSVLSAALLLSPLAARADQFIYAGANSVPGLQYNFTYVSDHRIVSDETVRPTSCVAQGQPCDSARFILQLGDGSAGSAEAFLDVSGPNGVSGGTDDIDPFYLLNGNGGLDQTENSSVLTVIDLPSSAPYFYEFVDNNLGVGFAFSSSDLITSRTTVSDFLCSAYLNPCPPSGSVTIDPALGQITGTGEYSGLNLSGLPANFFTPGLNLDGDPDFPTDGPLLLVAGRGGAETVTPEPSSLLLLGSGVSAAAALVRRRRTI